MNKDAIGKALSDLRKTRGESLMDVAKAIGSSQSAISMYENGERIPRDDIKLRLADHYGVSVEQIFFAR